MTEREKAAAGFLYDANYDEELARQRAECKDKCHRYNLCLPSDTAQQDEIMRGHPRQGREWSAHHRAFLVRLRV